METGLNQVNNLFQHYGMPLIWNLLGAIAIWVIGGWIITAIRNFIKRTMAARNMDSTLASYVDTSVSVLLKIMLVIAVLSAFGVQTTSIAAIIAAAGVAIGMAWSGLLANFAAGMFLILLRPFKVGDMITAGGATGEVKEIGMFATTLTTGDNLKVVAGNNKIFSDNIVNYTANPFRGVDLRCQIAHSVDPNDAIARLKSRVSQIANVQKTLSPWSKFLSLTPWAQCWWCGLSAITTIIGRCILIRIRRSKKCARKRVIPCLRRVKALATFDC